jgi:hypothetical protein
LFSGGPVARSLVFRLVFYPSRPPWCLVVVLLLDLWFSVSCFTLPDHPGV